VAGTPDREREARLYGPWTPPLHSQPNLDGFTYPTPAPGAQAGARTGYIAGFRAALAAGAERILEMDCDFSHSPSDVPRLLAATEEADLALGSRSADGGRIANWGLARRVISAGGSAYARIRLSTSIRDLTAASSATGGRCSRRSISARRSKGYAFQIETTYRALRAGFRVVEVPITFVDREVGGSKMSRALVLEAVWKVPQLRLTALAGKL